MCSFILITILVNCICLSDTCNFRFLRRQYNYGQYEVARGVLQLTKNISLGSVLYFSRNKVILVTSETIKVFDLKVEQSYSSALSAE